jgi:quercetin dioxygenase-like cupin family protein
LRDRALRYVTLGTPVPDTVYSMAGPIILGAEEGHTVSVRGSQIWFKATGADTAQAFSFIERVLPPQGRRPTPHRHTNCHEAFYVLEGTIEFEIERRPTSGAAGTFILVPPGGLHTFANRSDLDARLLILHSPAMDRYFVELHELLLNGGDLEAEQSLMERFGMELERPTM